MPNTGRRIWSASFTGMCRCVGEGSQLASKDEQRFIAGTRPSSDPQTELVRRYARLLRSAPAEAWAPRTTRDATPLPPRFGRPGRKPDDAPTA